MQQILIRTPNGTESITGYKRALKIEGWKNEVHIFIHRSPRNFWIVSQYETGFRMGEYFDARKDAEIGVTKKLRYDIGETKYLESLDCAKKQFPPLNTWKDNK